MRVTEKEAAEADSLAQGCLVQELCGSGGKDFSPGMLIVRGGGWAIAIVVFINNGILGLEGTLAVFYSIIHFLSPQKHLYNPKWPLVQSFIKYSK